jgi:hypothetical protein
MDDSSQNLFAVSTKTGTLGATQQFGEQGLLIRVSLLMFVKNGDAL